jgi:hypothetical protein
MRPALAPEGKVECPEGQVLGGEDAPARRHEALVRMQRLSEALRQLTDDTPWGEESDADIGDWRLPPSSFDDLLEQAERTLTRPRSLLDRVRGRPGYAPHFWMAS